MHDPQLMEGAVAVRARIGISSALVQVVLVFLAIPGLGKPSRSLQQLPRMYQNPTDTKGYMIKFYPRSMPSRCQLSTGRMEIVLHLFMLHNGVNFSQFVQGERRPRAM